MSSHLSQSNSHVSGGSEKLTVCTAQSRASPCVYLLPAARLPQHRRPPLLRCCCWVYFILFFCSVPAHQKPFHQSVCVTAYYQRISTSDSPQTPVIPHGTCVMQLGGKEKKAQTCTNKPDGDSDVIDLANTPTNIRTKRPSSYEDCHHHSLRPSKHICPTRLLSWWWWIWIKVFVRLQVKPLFRFCFVVVECLVFFACRSLNFDTRTHKRPTSQHVFLQTSTSRCLWGRRWKMIQKRSERRLYPWSLLTLQRFHLLVSSPLFCRAPLRGINV